VYCIVRGLPKTACRWRFLPLLCGPLERVLNRPAKLCTHAIQNNPETRDPVPTNPVTNCFNKLNNCESFLLFFKRCVLPCAFITLLSFASASTQAAQFIINGVEAELAENIGLVAGDVPEDDGLLEIYIDLLPEQASKALAAYGYYEPKIEIKKSIVDGAQIVTLNVDKGEPVTVRTISVKVNGPGKTDARFREILDERVPLKEKAIFLSGDYEATKGLLIDAAQAKGYFDFRFSTNTVLVSRQNKTADINLVAESGPRFTFGTIKFDQDVFSDTFLNRWVPFAVDDPYDATKIAEFTQNLQNSGYFSTVRVSPQRDVLVAS